jgi:hypothetical protein
MALTNSFCDSSESRKIFRLDLKTALTFLSQALFLNNSSNYGMQLRVY